MSNNDEAEKLALEIVELMSDGERISQVWLWDERRYADPVEIIADKIREYHRTQGILEP